MLCENCGQRQATVHQAVVVNGQKQESHLCEVCAQEKGFGMMIPPNFSFPNLSIQQLLSSFLGQEPFNGAGGNVVTRRQAEPQCRNCGMTYSEFADTGRLGCAQCYDDLEQHLTPLIKRIHGTMEHSGKAPKRTGGVLRKRRELAALKQQLNSAIHAEQYEEAARIRDAIRTMESQIQAGGDDGGVE